MRILLFHQPGQFGFLFSFFSICVISPLYMKNRDASQANSFISVKDLFVILMGLTAARIMVFCFLCSKGRR